MRLFALALLLTSARAAAADPSLQASLDRPAAPVGQAVVLTITVLGETGNVSVPAFPRVSGLKAVPAGRSQNVSIVNGEMTSSVELRFEIYPERVGAFAIPPINVNVGGKAMQTQPLTIRGTEPGQPQAAVPESPEIFVTAEVSEAAPYVGQQTTYIFRMYHRVQLLAQPQYSPPDFAGFIAQSLGSRQSSASRHGTHYRVSEVRYALFPVSPGKLEISPAGLRAQVSSGGSGNPLARFFDAGRSVAVSTGRVAVDVRPLPEAGKPAGFAGAVGSYRISAKLERSAAEAGKPITVEVKVTGKGLVKSVPEPVWPKIAGARFFETVTSVETAAEGDAYAGTKTFKKVMVPQASGLLGIPAIVLPVFDPAAGGYRVLKTAPLNVKVEPGPAPAGPDGQPETASGLKELNRDIRFLKGESGLLRAARPSVPGLGFWALQALPLLFLISGLLARIRAILAGRDPARSRARGALRRAERRLKLAERDVRSQNALAVHMAIQEALAGYLADRWAGSAAGLTLSQIQARLEAAQTPRETSERLRSLWEKADMIRYAPAAGEMIDLRQALRQTREILRDLEEKL